MKVWKAMSGLTSALRFLSLSHGSTELTED